MNEQNEAPAGKRKVPAARGTQGKRAARRSDAPSSKQWMGRLRVLAVVWTLILAVALVALYATWGLLPLPWGSGPDSSSPRPAGTAVPGATVLPLATSQWDARDVVVREANTRGTPDAPILIVEYSDFQCPFCRRFFSETEPQITAEYVATGKVRFAFKHLAALGDESILAAQAAECAADQGQFWEYHDELYRRAAEAGGQNVGAFTKDKLAGYAANMRLDQARFTSCLQNDETLERVRADTLEASRFGFNNTPSFLINDVTLVGAQPYATFAQVLERVAGR